MKRWIKAGRLILDIARETGHVVFFAYVGVSVARTVGTLCFALGLKPLIDGIATGPPKSVILGGIICALSLVLMVVTPAAGRWVFPRLIERSVVAMRRRLLQLISAAPRLDHLEHAAFWDRVQLLKRRFADLLESMATVFVGPLVLAQMCIAAVLLLRLHPLLVVLPLVALPAAELNKRAERVKQGGEARAAEKVRAAEHLFSISTSADSAKEVRVYGLQEELLRGHAVQSWAASRTRERATLKSVCIASAAWGCFGAVYLLAVLVALNGAATRQLTAGDVALILAVAAALVVSAGQLAQLGGLLVRAITVSDEYHWLADRTSAADGAQPAPSALEEGFHLDNVSFAYPSSDTPVLDSISIRLRPGSVVALVGENGAGKTTLVKLLTRMYDPSAGRITLEGRDLTSIETSQYRSQATAGFQDFARFEFLVRETVGVGDLTKLEDGNLVLETIRKARGEFVQRLPAGLETQLGQSWTEGVDLSQGQWQKLAIARALLRRNPLLAIFDEPTSSLDPQAEHSFFQQIATEARNNARGGVTLLISHRFSTVRMADWIIVLKDGKVHEQGTHQALMGKAGLYAELYDLQAAAYA